ncbi:hypothetical protein AB0395_47780 [Streptosporangium sp. NPDC051023]|uniref:hypothetical protein n=1 Tax=Streptosporangium sp. NPDC051023 TaxID=3155410 RepID=UPI00344E972D
MKLKELPGKAEFHEVEAHIYVVEMSNDILKVGYSNHPHQRISKHAQNAGAFGAAITAVWVSPPCCNARAAERAMIEYGHASGTAANNNEYFKGLTFSEMIAFAESLKLEPISEDTIEQVMQQRRDHIMTLRELHGLNYREPDPELEPDLVEALRDGIAKFMGRRADDSYTMPSAGITMDHLNEPEELLDLFGTLAEKKGVPIQQILEMSWADVRGAVVAEMLRAEIARLKTFAIQAGHTHVTETLSDYITRMIQERDALRSAIPKTASDSSSTVE